MQSFMQYLAAAMVGMALLAGPSAAPAQLPSPWGSPAAQVRLSGTYRSTSTNRVCTITRAGGVYVFVNDSGSRARFVPDAAGRFVQVGGSEWDPSVVATVSLDRFGRRVIRFDSPNAPTGFWVSDD